MRGGGGGEEEGFPIKFGKGIRSYWRRRKYRRLKGAAAGKEIRLGGGSGRRRLGKLRSGIRIRVRIPSPVRILCRLRDAYVDAMLGLAGKGSGLAAPTAGQEAMLARRIPRAKARPVRPAPGEFERRLILEIYKSVLASSNGGIERVGTTLISFNS